MSTQTRALRTLCRTLFTEEASPMTTQTGALRTLRRTLFTEEASR